MDTRNKIISADAAIEVACQVKQQGRGLTVVTGYFDVLGAAQVRDLTAVRKGTDGGVLMVLLLPRREPLLPVRARAELVAGLSMVDYVVIEGKDSLLRRLPADEIIARQDADDEQTRLLIEHVHGRHTV